MTAATLTDRQWTCLRCRHTETQPAHVTAVVHLCGIGRRPVALKPDPTEGP